MVIKSIYFSLKDKILPCAFLISHFDKLHVIIISYQIIFCRLLSLWTVSRLSFNWQCQILLWFHFLLSREGIFLEIFPCSEHLIWTRLVWSVSVKLIVANPHNLDECHKVSSRITQQYPNQAVTRILEKIANLIWKDNRHKDIYISSLRTPGIYLHQWSYLLL